MKKNTTIFIFLISLLSGHSSAQPGDRYLEDRLRWFNEAQDSIKKYPDDLFHRWVRLDILFAPQFHITTKPTDSLMQYLASSSQYYLYVKDSFDVDYNQMSERQLKKDIKEQKAAAKLGIFLLLNQEELINDLTSLIKSDIVFNSRSRYTSGHYNTATKSAFFLKRGQLYYVTGHPEKALQDYLKAIENNPDKVLIRHVYTSIAAYYYSKKNYSVTLNYTKLAEPAKEDTTCFKGERPEDYNYERVKLDIMKEANDSTSFVSYLQNRSASYLNYYYSLIQTSNAENRLNSESQSVFTRSKEYELMIYSYLLELNPEIGADEFKKHKKAIVNKL